MSTEQRRAAVYARQSHGKAISVADQVARGREACEREGWRVDREVRDTVSASRFGTRERGGWSELVTDVDAGRLDVVVLWDASRGDRTPETWAGFLERCRKRGVLIHSVRARRTYDLSSPEDWKTLHDSGTAAGYDSEIKSADARRGLAAAAVAGKPHGVVRYGYSRVFAPDGAVTHVPNEHAPVAREIVERIARRDPIESVMRSLNERGIPSPAGKRWSRETVKRIARNAGYAGLRSHRGTLYPATWEPIVTEALWRSAVAVLGEQGRKESAPGATRWLLSYMVLAPCGSVMTAQPLHKRAGPPRYHCRDDGCCSAEMPRLDDLIERYVFGFLARPGVRSLLEASTEDADAALAELRRYESQLEEARVSFDAPDGISAVALARKERALTPLIDAARRRHLELSEQGAVLDLLGKDEFTEQTARPRWEALSVAARRAVVAALLPEIRVGHAPRRLSRWADEDERDEMLMSRVTVRWFNEV